MFHFQDPIVDWSQCIPWIPVPYLVKAVDQVQMLSELKNIKPGIQTVLRHWYTAQVPDSVPGSAEALSAFKLRADLSRKSQCGQYHSLAYVKRRQRRQFKLLQIPDDTLEDNRQRARTFFDTFVDGTFMEHAANVDFIEEWNEYFGNGMPAEERQRFILWAQAAAEVWSNEYRSRSGLEHIRLILANTAVGNDIPVEVAEAAVNHDCLLGYHSYWPTRANHVPGDAWPYYEGRWTEMDKLYKSQGLSVDWALTEAGPVLYHGDWPSVTLGPLDGWRHCDVHNADVERYIESITLFMDRWLQWNLANDWRVSNPMLFTSGFFGWVDFQIWQPQLNDISENVYYWTLQAPPDPDPIPPPPSPDPGLGLPRVQYRRVYNVLPPHATESEALAVFQSARDRNLETVGYSYDDAGIGSLGCKMARLYGIPDSKRQTYIDWYAEFYPGTAVEFYPLS
jgi:hypothetical protein